MNRQITQLLSPLRSAWQRLDRFLESLVRQVGIWWVVVVVFSALVIYFLIQVVMPLITLPAAYLYFWQPLLWSGLALLAGLGWRYGLKWRPRPGGLIWIALILAVFQVAMLLMAGLLQGFGRSPFSHHLLSMLGNLWYLATMLVGMELSRAYLMGAMGRRLPVISLALTTFLFTLLTTPLGMIYKFDNLPSAIEVSGTLLLPNLAQNLLASLLVFGGGPLVSILYRGILLAFEWFSPVLPNPDWFLRALVETLLPAIGMVLVYNYLMASPSQGSPQVAEGKKTEGFNLAWAFVAVFGLLVVGFNTGLFGVQPTLVASNSMSPTFYAGDVVITRDIDPAEIAVGDIIRFREGNHSVVHRVVEIHEGEGRRVFITRGDTNDANDPPIIEQALQGKMIMTIPKVGWLSIFLRQLISGASG